MAVVDIAPNKLALAYLEWYEKIAPHGKLLPISYFIRSADLLITLQPLTLMGGVEFPPPLDAPTFRLRGGPLSGNPRPQFVFNYATTSRGGPRTSIYPSRCIACGRHAATNSPTRWAALCSSLCFAALRHFHNDIQALLGRSRETLHFHPSHLLRFAPPNLINAGLRRQRLRNFNLPNKHTIHGYFADLHGLHYASTFFINPISLRRGLKRAMTQAERQKNDDPKARTAPEPLRDPTAVSAMAETHNPVPISAEPDGIIGSHSLLNPVASRAAQIVLRHLETANDFLSNTKKPTKHLGPITDEGVVWNRDQVNLFLGLLNRTIPAISASINLNEQAPPKDPSEMTREELEAAARRAKVINASPADKKPERYQR